MRRAQVLRSSVCRSADRPAALEAAGSQGRLADRDPRTGPRPGVRAARRHERDRQRGLPQALDLAPGQPTRDTTAGAVLHPRRRPRDRSRGRCADGSAFALAQNAIVVEPQYRLGALGFFGLPGLAAEDPNGSTGNYGFLDQLEALRWVRDNIAAFGGDPNQVTIAGQSAGGWSVCALMASPLSTVCSARGSSRADSATTPVRSPTFRQGARCSATRTSARRSNTRSRESRRARAATADDLAVCARRPPSSLVQALGAQPGPSTAIRPRIPPSTATSSRSSRSVSCARARPITVRS